MVFKLKHNIIIL